MKASKKFRPGRKFGGARALCNFLRGKSVSNSKDGKYCLGRLYLKLGENVNNETNILEGKKETVSFV